MEELVPDKPKPKKKRKKSKTWDPKKKKIKTVPPLQEIPSQFTITISYYPLARANTAGRSEESEYSLELRVLGKKAAKDLYKEIIQEVQEQHPGEGYLDKLVSKLFEGDGLVDAVPEENIDDDD